MISLSLVSRTALKRLTFFDSLLAAQESKVTGGAPSRCPGGKLKTTLLIGCLSLAFAATTGAAEMQGVIADWDCAKQMVEQGRAKVLKSRRSCSMMKNYNRAAYGLITDDNKYYRLEDPGNAKIRQMLKDTPDKDNLKVVVSGDQQGDTIKVLNITEL
jgi:hypothetical protein